MAKGPTLAHGLARADDASKRATKIADLVNDCRLAGARICRPADDAKAFQPRTTTRGRGPSSRLAQLLRPPRLRDWRPIVKRRPVPIDEAFEAEARVTMPRRA
jgi:hypothetical protein